MIRPVPGGSRLHNLSATLLRHGNTAQALGSGGIERIARYQDLCPIELRRELVMQEKLNKGGLEEGCDK